MERIKPNTHRRRDATVELSRVDGVYGIRNWLATVDESEQICQQRVELRRVAGVNAPVGSCRELVANCVHTDDADATQLDSCVASASSVCIGHYVTFYTDAIHQPRLHELTNHRDVPKCTVTVSP